MCCVAEIWTSVSRITSSPWHILSHYTTLYLKRRWSNGAARTFRSRTWLSHLNQPCFCCSRAKVLSGTASWANLWTAFTVNGYSGDMLHLYLLSNSYILHLLKISTREDRMTLIMKPSQEMLQQNKTWHFCQQTGLKYCRVEEWWAATASDRLQMLKFVDFKLLLQNKLYTIRFLFRLLSDEELCY